MSHLSTLLHHPNLSNLVELYEPVKLFSKALRDPQTILEGKRAIRHDSFAPDFDLRETAEAYFLDGEFPGVNGRDSIKLKWLDGSTLHIEAHIHKVSLEKEWGVITGTPSAARPDDHSTPTPAVSANGEWEEVAVEKAKQEKDGNDGGKEDSVRTWLNERRVGAYTRTFGFPNAIHTDGIQARLSQGLLRIMVPKIDKSKLKSKEIYIENVES